MLLVHLVAAGRQQGRDGLRQVLIVIDDPVKNRAQAESETYRNRVWDWYKDDLYTRLEPDGSIPEDNPEFEGVTSHVYTYGHRNMQGIDFGPDGIGVYSAAGENYVVTANEGDPQRILLWAGNDTMILAYAAGLLMLADVLMQDFGIHPVWHTTRLVTGALVGWVASAALMTAIKRERRLV